MSIWVIGASSGIGRATADLLQDKYIGGVVYRTAENVDVRDEAALTEFWEASPDINRVVYCAGVNTLMWNEDQDLDIVRDMFDVNLFGFMRIVKIMAQRKMPQNLVAVTSDAATRPMRTSMAYCASKAALSMAIKQAAREHAGHIKVNGVAPGMIDGTGMQEYIDRTVPEIRNWTPEAARHYETSQIPISRRGSVREVASVIEFLLCDSPDYMTGSIVEVNGGR